MRSKKCHSSKTAKEVNFCCTECSTPLKRQFSLLSFSINTIFGKMLSFHTETKQNIIKQTRSACIFNIIFFCCTKRINFKRCHFPALGLLIILKCFLYSCQSIEIYSTNDLFALHKIRTRFKI